jgi:hypothetical protein
MTTDASKHEIKLRRTGGAGPNTQWQWEIHKDGKLLKSGTVLGEEHKAFATARRASDRLAKG